MFKTIITDTLKDVSIWNDNLVITPNKNIRGQSFSFFICDKHNTPLFIAKFFNYLKGFNIPDSINMSTLESLDLLIVTISLKI